MQPEGSWQDLCAADTRGSTFPSYAPRGPSSCLTLAPQFFFLTVHFLLVSPSTGETESPLGLNFETLPSFAKRPLRKLASRS